ncbi:hypothetical protein GBA63_21590 [Rubrobacter tropicus]|uniref:RING-type E3 ubiquitin transferase n=1 Tax=Rubrobacter tropicus TaxID=2653851 RepID=A0A6G8QFD0_9ACTN|nr:E3 ubiquitin ligase family protein [Rubrobacter tropicus]QIN84947.1 hypothetical protein GBA63_21590 [Rubrobacter tropicus]
MVAAVIFLLVGVALWVAAGVVLFFRGRTKGKASAMAAVETSGAADVASLAPGSPVEVKGTLRCEAPLESEMAGEACAYYSSRVIREYIRQDRDDDNDVGSDRRSETISHSERFAPFHVEDATGRVAVDAEGAEIDAREVMDRFERHTDGASVTIAGATINLGGGERTIGFRYAESVLPVDAPVYVLGAVGEDGSIGAPAGDEEKRFVVSYRSEEALGAQIGKDARLLGFVAAGLAVGGLVFAAVGVAGLAGIIQFT